MISLFRMVVFTRWARYLTAGIMLSSGLLIAMSAFIGTMIRTTSGTVQAVYVDADSRTGAYKFDQLVLNAGSASFTFYRNGFTPHLTEDMIHQGDKVNIWFMQAPYNDPDAVALRFYEDQSATPVKYVTTDYLHPENLRRSNLTTAAIFLAVGLVAMIASILLPVAGRRAQRNKSAGAASASYGAIVVGPPRGPRHPGERLPDHP